MTANDPKSFKDSITDRRLCTFYVGSLFCGLDLSQIREITTPTAVTKVYLASPIIQGVVNIRGQIVTIIDLKKRLEISDASEPSQKSQAILVDYKGTRTGLLVDHVQDIVPLEPQLLQPSPAHMAGVQGKFFSNIYKRDKQIIAVLDLSEVLRLEEPAEESLVTQEA